MHSHAQYEIQVYAEVIADMVKAWVPLAYEAFDDYRVGGSFFSREEVEIIRQVLSGEDVNSLLPASSLSMRERREFRRKLKLGPPPKRSE